MPEPVSEYLEQEMKCEGLLECVHGLKSLDRDSYRVLVESDESMTVDGVSEVVDRERSTTYRSVQRLLNAGLVQKEQVNYDEGGYYHVYYPTEADEVADEMRRKLNDWYAEMDRLIREFERKYAEADTG
jgi:predicted transcriptional regulator